MSESTAKTKSDEKPKDRRFRKQLGFVLVTLVVINLAFVVSLFVIDPRPVNLDLLQAEEFMKAIELGNSESDAGKKTGYELAFDLLLPEAQEGQSFENFLYFFDDQVQNYGFVQSWKPESREYGSYQARRLRFEVEYGGLGDPSTFVTYEFQLRRDEDGQVGISDFALISTSKTDN